MKGTKTIFHTTTNTLTGFLLVLLISFAFLVISSQKAFAADASSINIPSSYVNIGQPEGLVVLPDGNVWYVDVSNFRIVLYNPSTNTIVRTVGRLGDADGEFQEGIRAITVDNNGYLYIVHAGCQVYKLDSNGGFIGKYALNETDSNCTDTTTEGIHYDSYSDSIFITYREKGTINKFSKNLVFISSFGGNGSVDGQFYWPIGVTTDASGKIYVADSRNDRIQVFSPSYTHLLNLNGPWDDIGGTTGFNFPNDVVILSDGTITATSTSTPSIEQFSPVNSGGTHIRTWSHQNDGGIQDVRTPMYLTRDSSNNVYVSDYWIKTLTKYSSTGTWLGSMRNTMLTDDKLYWPTDVAYCPNGNMYVIDGSEVNNSRVQEFSGSGTYLFTILSYNNGDGELSQSSEHIDCDTSGNLWVSAMHDVRVFTGADDTWTLTKTITISSGGQIGGFALSGDDLYIPNLQDTDIMKYTLDEETGDYSYVGSFGGGWDKVGDPRLASPEYLTAPLSVVIDDNGHFFVADSHSLKEFDETGTYVQNLGTGPNYDNGHDDPPSPAGFQSSYGVSIDPTNHNIYSTDASSCEVDVFDNVTGERISTIGNPGGGTLGGGGQLYFYRPRNSEINPSTGTLTIVDTENSRVQALTTGYRIINLIPSANIIVRSGDNIDGSLSNQAWDPDSFSTPTAIPARLFFGDYAVADFTVNLSSGDLDWRDVNVQFLPLTSKSLVVNLNQTDAPGISTEHSLYLSRYSNQTSATVCPNATQLFGDTSDAVVEGCNGGYVLTYGINSAISQVTINDRNYWKIDHLTGTGAFSSLYESVFDMSDVMTRQKVNTASNHEITFGTTYDINHIDDTITISFSSDWDIADSLTASDLSLYRGDTQLTLGSAPANDTWVATFGSDPNQILLTAPLNVDVSDQAISAGSVIKLLINNDKLINPNSVALYDINIQILTDSETNNEIGTISVPIVDSDTVNIEGFVTSDLYFDIDTGTGETPSGGQSPTDVNCDYNTCLAYETGDAAANYTVDLGHLNMTGVNKSNYESVLHSDGGEGLINSIYFDLSTNSASGAVLTYQSLYGELRGPGHSITAADDLDIPTTNGTTDIVRGVSAYGIQLATAPVYKNIGTGTQTVNCGNTSSTYCVMGDINPTTGVNEQTAEPLYTVTGPIELGRGKIDVAVAIDGTVVPGTYTDEVTFIATTIF